MRLRLPPWLLRAVGGTVVSLLVRSWRITTSGESRWRELQDSERPFVFLLWHEALLPLLWRHRGQGIAIVVSEARDGQYLADYAAALGYRLVRGSSTRGATRALLGAVRELEAGTPVAFTPDGPQGPRRELKRGVVAAAQRAGAAILPIHADARSAWRFRSWDRFMLPRPFARVRIAYGEPFVVDPGPEGLERGLERARSALEQVTRSLECPDGAATPTA
ncbi:MAG: lysophospholipid acyltransferase family protein [Gemmatimonadales bacterium]